MAEQPSRCSQHSCQGVASQAEQLAEQVTAQTFLHLLGTKPLALAQKIFDGAEEQPGLFLLLMERRKWILRAPGEQSGLEWPA